MSLRANGGGNMFMVGRESGAYADGFVDAYAGGFAEPGPYCCLSEYRMYFVVYSGVLQVIEIGSNARLSGIDCDGGVVLSGIECNRPVILYNLNTGRGNSGGMYMGAIGGPVEVSMASSVVVHGAEGGHGYPTRDSEALRHMTVVVRWSFPDYAHGGAERQTGWVMVPYALADSLAAWIALRAPAVRVEWRLPERIDLT
jgi:hypothetical protein